MNDRFKRRSIWALGLFLSGTCFVVAFRKLTHHPVTMATHESWGTPSALILILALLETVAGAMMPFRRSAFAGATLFSMIVLGAILMHVLHGQYSKLPLPALFLFFSAGYAMFTCRQEPR